MLMFGRWIIYLVRSSPRPPTIVPNLSSVGDLSRWLSPFSSSHTSLNVVDADLRARTQHTGYCYAHAYSVSGALNISLIVPARIASQCEALPKWWDTFRMILIVYAQTE